MREIKFRQPIYSNGNFSKWHYWGFTERGDSFIGPVTGPGRRENYQYTGLKDANGVEIYEGDVVLHQWGKYDEKITFVIIFKEGCFGIDPVHEKTQGGENTWFCVLTHGDNKNTEVIGNIHQHPELLED